MFIIGISLEKQGRSFEQNKKSGKAEVVGYERADQSNWYTLLVRIPKLNDGKIYNCSAGKIKISDYPKGSVIDVWYAEKKIVGLKVVEVHLLNNPPADGMKIGSKIKKFSILLFALTAALAVVGLIILLFI